MPLQSGSSQKVVSSNIRELHKGPTFAHTSSKFGKKKADKQSVAIALSESRGRAMGGVAPMMSQAFNPVMPGASTNGVAGASVVPPQTMGGAGLNGMMPGPAGARPLKKGGVAVGTSKPVGMTVGPLVSSVPGRTDKHFTHVPSGAYVIPADIVSAHGQGNTLAGMKALHQKFNLGTPHLPKLGSSYPAKPKKFARGGSDQHVGKPVPVKLAGGEIVVPPGNVHEAMKKLHGKKDMTLEEAHRAMDKWVLDERKKLRKTLAKLPGPVVD